MALPDCVCVSGPLSEQLADIYCAARAWSDDASLPECICVRGLPLGEQLTAIYEAVYTAAADDTLPAPLCIRGYPLGEQLTAIYEAILPLTADADLPSVLCIRGLPLFQQVDAIFCAALQVAIAPEFDPDAEAFFLAAGITDETQKDAVNTLVVDLKAESLWDKMTALYPFVGGTADSHSFNLVDPALYQITWSGGIVHDANGVTGNGTTGFGDTNLPRTDLPLVLTHLAAYIHTVTPGVDFHGVIGVDDEGAGSTQWTNLFHSAGHSFENNSTGTAVSFGINPGMVIGSRSATDDQILDAAEVTFTSAAAAAPAANLALDLFVLALNRAGTAIIHATDTFALISAGDELSLAEALAYRTIVNTYQTALGRNV